MNFSARPRMIANRSALVVIDVQARLIDRVDRRDETLAAIIRAIRAASLLAIPTTATEQYPKGLGPTVPEVATLVETTSEKTTFHSADAPTVARLLGSSGPPRAVTLVGVEAHICVAQTAIELMTRGHTVQVLADAVTSRHPVDRDIALARLAASGAIISTVEAAIFEWAETSRHPQFKALSALVKEADRERSAI